MTNGMIHSIATSRETRIGVTIDNLLYSLILLASSLIINTDVPFKGGVSGGSCAAPIS